jgi:hypothetical protein
MPCFLFFEYVREWWDYNEAVYVKFGHFRIRFSEENSAV